MKKHQKFAIFGMIALLIIAAVVSVWQMVTQTGFDKLQIGNLLAFGLIGLALAFVIIKDKGGKDE